ncbi:MAG: glycosyltransferase [Armatimonadetes bacterium]|nr:glycosyltransferase [Armatimonadota bacterium]
MPRVSILLTCFNHLKYVPAAVEGVLGQTFRDYEVIALDDGSTDGTRDWLTENLGGHRLVFNPQNLGTYATLNVGLREARGEFVAVLNDDDVWAPEKLERQLALMDAHPKVGLCHTDGWFIDGEGRRTEGSPLGFEFPRTATGDVLLALLSANKIIASAALVRRECFDRLGGFDESYFGSGDWQMWTRIAEQYDVGYVDRPLTFYRVHGANASHKLDRIWRDDEKLREWIASRTGSYRGRFQEAELERAVAHNYACLGTVKTLNGDPAGGRAAYRESLRHDPGRWKSRLRLWATYLPKPVFRKLI